MRIGIDIDDTLVSSSESFDEVRKKYNISFSKSWKDEWTQEERDFIFKKYLDEILLGAKFKENSIEVKNFSELVNAQVELRTPIVFSEVIKNELGLFVLFNNEHAYYYTLKSTERKKKA